MPKDTRQFSKSSTDKSITRKIGLHYACYQLSRRGWKVTLNTQNVGGIAIVAEAPGRGSIGINVSASSKHYAVRLTASADLGELPEDYRIIVANVAAEPPDPHVFILRSEEVKKLARQDNGGWWLEPKDYRSDRYQDAWDRLEDREA